MLTYWSKATDRKQRALTRQSHCGSSLRMHRTGQTCTRLASARVTESREQDWYRQLYRVTDLYVSRLVWLSPWGRLRRRKVEEGDESREWWAPGPTSTWTGDWEQVVCPPGRGRSRTAHHRDLLGGQLGISAVHSHSLPVLWKHGIVSTRPGSTSEYDMEWNIPWKLTCRTPSSFGLWDSQHFRVHFRPWEGSLFLLLWGNSRASEWMLVLTYFLSPHPCQPLITQGKKDGETKICSKNTIGDSCHGQ